MAKNKPTPLKDEPVMSLDDISTKLDNLAASIGAIQKEPCEPVVPKVNIQVKGLHFKTEEEFREKVILLFRSKACISRQKKSSVRRSFSSIKVWESIIKNRKMLISRSYTKKGNFPTGRCFRQFTRRLAPFQMIIIMRQTL